MGEAIIGAGGWAYFNVPPLSPLRAYSRAFDFVEANSTFYEIPTLAEAKRWRRSVPDSFRFAVRAHRSITHGRPFENSDLIHENLERMLAVCRALRAEVLHFQLPPSVAPDGELAGRFSDALNSVRTGDTLLAMEIRGRAPRESSLPLLRLMQDRGIIHAVDLLQGQVPAYEAGALYARLFGQGYRNLYRPKDEELEAIDDYASGFSRAYITFHGVRMYSDAARLKAFRATGKFPQVTKAVGLESLGEVLKEDAKFPSTKEVLLREQGWKLFDATRNRRMRAGEALSSLPAGNYDTLREILGALRHGAWADD